MRIRSLTAFHVSIGLKSPVSHASFTRYENDTLIVRCELMDGTTGWGEGLPRTYVTGESIDSVWRHLAATDFSQIGDHDYSIVPNVIEAIDDFTLSPVAADAGVEVRECFGNSVRCAVELSLLDAFSKLCEVSVGDVFQFLPGAPVLSQPQNQVRYSGVVTSGKGLKQWRSGLKMRLFGFQAIKAKVGTAGVDDASFLGRIRSMVGEKVDLRLDANEAWECEEVASKLNRLSQYRPSSLEQPVAHADVAGLAEVRREISVPLMLDESLCSIADAQHAIRLGTCDLFNLRISKCGGLINCFRLAFLAKENQLGYQLGCQVGETGILSAAGRQFACNVGGIRYLEGSYDRFLVKDRLTTQNLTIGYGGHAPRLGECGLGVDVDQTNVERLCKRSLQLI